MSTKKNGYVRRINCTCYKELSQSLKIKYTGTLEGYIVYVIKSKVKKAKKTKANLARKYYETRALERKVNLARKSFETEALFKKGLNFFRSLKVMNVLRL